MQMNPYEGFDLNAVILLYLCKAIKGISFFLKPRNYQFHPESDLYNRVYNGLVEFLVEIWSKN